MAYKSKKKYLCSLIFRLNYSLIKYSLVFLFSISETNLHAQNLITDNSNFFYQISPVYDFKKSIVSLTFDDGFDIQFTVGVPMLKERNLPATFYIITDRVDSVTKSITFPNLPQDYEIGSHTVTHANLIKIGQSEAFEELLNSKLYLKKYFGVNAGLTMSYPWGMYNNYVQQIVKNLYLAARATDPGYNSLSTPDKFALKVQNFDSRTNSGVANSWVDLALQNRLWLVEMIHGINKTGYSPVDSGTLAEHLDYIKKSEDEVWCGNVENVIKYIDESEKTVIKCDVCDDTVFQIGINDFMDDSIYNQPLSIRVKIPDNWDSITISNTVNFKTEYKYKSKFILFNALPDNKQITIRPKLISASVKEPGIRLVYLSANPFHDYIKLSLDILDQQDIDIVLCNMSGKLLIHQKEKAVIGVINLFFDTSEISNGPYFLRVRGANGDLIIEKLIRI
jgi:peptidoglycan/xylan/chitin deacetylase (PgdA/CDA1 family)